MDEDDKWLLRGNHQAEEIILIGINGYKSKPYFGIRVDSKKNYTWELWTYFTLSWLTEIKWDKSEQPFAYHLFCFQFLELRDTDENAIRNAHLSH